MAAPLLGLGSILLAIAFVLWRDGSSWGLLIASFLGMHGAMLVAWGLIAGWFRSVVACIAASVIAAAAAVVALLWVQGGWWQWGIACALGSLLALIVGVSRARQLLRARRRGPD